MYIKIYGNETDLIYPIGPWGSFKIKDTTHFFSSKWAVTFSQITNLNLVQLKQKSPVKETVQRGFVVMQMSVEPQRPCYDLHKCVCSVLREPFYMLALIYIMWEIEVAMSWRPGGLSRLIQKVRFCGSVLLLPARLQKDGRSQLAWHSTCEMAKKLLHFYT